MKDFYYIFRNKKQILKHVERFRIKDIDYGFSNEKLTKRIDEIKDMILHSLPEYENIEHFHLNGSYESVCISFIYKDKPSCEHNIVIDLQNNDFSKNSVKNMSILYSINDITYSYLGEDKNEYLKMIDGKFFEKIKHNFFRSKIENRTVFKGAVDKDKYIDGIFNTISINLFYKLFSFAHRKKTKEITTLLDLKKYTELSHNVSSASWGFNTIYKNHSSNLNLDCFLKSENKIFHLLMESYRLLLIKDDFYNKISNKDILLLLDKYKDNIFSESNFIGFRHFNQNNFNDIIDILRVSDGYNQNAKDLIDLQYQF